MRGDNAVMTQAGAGSAGVDRCLKAVQMSIRSDAHCVSAPYNTLMQSIHRKR